MARHLFAILDDLTANLAELKAALAPLTLLGSGAAVQPRKHASTRRRPKNAAARGRPPVSRARRAALKEQGRYMAALRGLTREQRARVRKARASKGVQAAIALARKLAG